MNILLNYLKEINNALCSLRYLSGKKWYPCCASAGHITVKCMRILVSWVEKFLPGY